jgi:hypothetical protein
MELLELYTGIEQLPTVFPHRRISVLDRNFLSASFMSIFTLDWRLVTLDSERVNILDHIFLPALTVKALKLSNIQC